MLFLILAWRKWLLHVRDILWSSSTRSTGFGSLPYEPCPSTDFFFSFFLLTGRRCHFRFRVPANRCQVTRVRLPSTNICWSPRDPHSFLTVILWRLATVNSNTGNSINLISIVSVGHHVTVTTLNRGLFWLRYKPQDLKWRYSFLCQGVGNLCVSWYPRDLCNFFSFKHLSQNSHLHAKPLFIVTL